MDTAVDDINKIEDDIKQINEDIEKVRCKPICDVIYDFVKLIKDVLHFLTFQKLFKRD